MDLPALLSIKANMDPARKTPDTFQVRKPTPKVYPILAFYSKKFKFIIFLILRYTIPPPLRIIDDSCKRHCPGFLQIAGKLSSINTNNTIKMYLTKLKNSILAASVVAMLGACSSSENKSVFNGTLQADGIEDMVFNYAPDYDLMSVSTIQITPDSLGNFTFPDSLLVNDDLHTQILADNDYFGLYLEKGKSVNANIDRNADGKLTITFTGDNADINTYYNALCQAFDSMKYFSPDPEGGSSLDEYFATLEKENSEVRKGLDAIKDPEKRAYYEKMTDRMYTWTKIRLLMDRAFEQGIDVKEIPEYVQLVGTIDPNDDMSLMCTLIFPWLNMQTKSDEKDALANSIEQLHILDKNITNENTRKVMLNQLPYVFFAYSQPTMEQAETYMKEYSKVAEKYPELIERYNLRKESIKEIEAGDALPYDPVIETPDGKKAKLSDFKGKVTYIDFWATWCGPCCKQIPYLEKLVEKMKDNKDVVFVSISSDTDREAWLNKLKKDNPTWPQYILPAEECENFFSSMNITGIPRFIILNADGTIAQPNALRPSDEAIESQILSAVK